MGTGFDLVSRVLFPTPESSYTVEDFPDELIFIPKSLNPGTASPEDCVPCLCLLSPSSRFLVLYLHANAEDLGRCYQFCSMLRHQFQVHVLAVEFPGYGICPGGPADDASVMDNVHTAFRFIREVLCWPLDGILLLGRSIGTGLALRLASKNEVYGVILVSPFLSVKELCRHVVGPLSYLVQERFPNEEMMPKLRSPLLVVHGKKDLTVPVEHGKELFRLCRSRKRLVCPEDMEHNTNLHTNISYFVLPMLQFFALPDYCFDDLRLPEWCYDRRLSVQTSRNMATGICTQNKKSHMEVPDTILRTGVDSTPSPRGGREQAERSLPQTPDLQGKTWTTPREAAAAPPRTGTAQCVSGSGLPGDKDPEPPDDWAEMALLNASRKGDEPQPQEEPQPEKEIEQEREQEAKAENVNSDEEVVSLPLDPPIGGNDGEEEPPHEGVANAVDIDPDKDVEHEDEELPPASEEEEDRFIKVPRTSATIPLLGDLGRPLQEAIASSPNIKAVVPMHLPVLGAGQDANPKERSSGTENTASTMVAPAATQQALWKVPKERKPEESNLPVSKSEPVRNNSSSASQWQGLEDTHPSGRASLTSQGSKEWVV